MPSCRGEGCRLKCTKEKIIKFLKMGVRGVGGRRLLLGHSLITIKLTLVGFFPKISNLTPLPLKLRTKE